MTIDPTGEFLINSITNKPVFITGEDAWALSNQLDNADMQAYLSRRASQGFNAIWVGAADNVYQTKAPANRYGDAPFNGADFTNENPSFWAHLDNVVHQAETLGITVFLDPGFVGAVSADGYLASYQNTSATTLKDYGAFLGARYANAPNIVWALGGDWDPSTLAVSQLNELATGIRSADSIHLITVEVCRECSPVNQSSMDGWKGSPSIDLNWVYARPASMESSCFDNYVRSGALPALAGEDWYENDHSMTGLQIREESYWEILSGCTLGRFFGNDPIWCFGSPQAVAGCYTGTTWQAALKSPGSLAEAWQGRLMRSREFWKMVPDIHHKAMIAGYDSRSFFSSTWESLRAILRREPYHSGSESSVASRTADGQTIIVYIPNGNAATITIAMDQITDAESRANCWWFNPRDGSSSPIGGSATRGTRRFVPPDANDWILVIDSRAANLGAPGSGEL